MLNKPLLSLSLQRFGFTPLSTERSVLVPRPRAGAPSPISPSHLPYISPVSPPYLPRCALRWGRAVAEDVGRYLGYGGCYHDYG